MNLATFEVEFPLSLLPSLNMRQFAEVFQQCKSGFLAQPELLELGITDYVLTLTQAVV